MKKILSILISIQLLSCSEITTKNDFKKSKTENSKKTIQAKNSQKDIEISQQEKEYFEFVDSVNIFKIQPIDTLLTEYNNKQLEKYKIGNNTIQISKKDSINIDWIKINSNKVFIKNLKTINPRVDGKREEMFCNSLQRIKLYNFNFKDIVFLEFTSHPCNGLGCSVTDYLIYDVKNNEVNLFGNFRTADLDLYRFPFNKKLNYIATEYQGDFHGSTPIHFISRIYSLENNGKFRLEFDHNGKEYYYEYISFPNKKTDEIEFKLNWF